MFKIRFDFDFETYKKNVKHYKKTGNKPLHFTDTQRTTITNACKLMERVSRVLATPGAHRNERDALVRKWFKKPGNTSIAGITNYLSKMNRVIADPSRTVTFADGSKRHLKIDMDPDNIDATPTWRDKPVSSADMRGVEAWVFPLPGNGTLRQPSEYHAGSGFRILLGKAFPFSADLYEKAGVIYHELTHKILGTNDHAYGERSCMQLPAGRVMKNADNYNLLFQEFGKTI